MDGREPCGCLAFSIKMQTLRGATKNGDLWGQSAIILTCMVALRLKIVSTSIYNQCEAGHEHDWVCGFLSLKLFWKKWSPLSGASSPGVGQAVHFAGPAESRQSPMQGQQSPGGTGSPRGPPCGACSPWAVAYLGGAGAFPCATKQ